MKKSNFYKEWIKTRRYFPIALTVSVIFIIYALLGVQRVINFRGVAHLFMGNPVEQGCRFYRNF